MNILESKNDGLKKTYKISISSKIITEKTEGKVSQIQKQAKLPGFRPGHVPENYLNQRYGESITQETIDELVRADIEELIKKEEIRMASQPKIDIEKYEDGKDLEYSFECETFPEVTEKTLPFEKIKLTQYKIDVPESEVQKQIELDSAPLKSHKKVDDKAAKIKKGQAAKIDYKGFIDGEQFEGGTAEGHILEIGSGNFIDNFEDQLIGQKVGDEKKVKVKFPKNYHNKKFEGKAAVFEVKIHEILDVTKGDLTDEFAKSKGATDVADYKVKVRELIQNSLNTQSDNQLKKELFDYIENKVKLDLPDAMVDQEFKALIDEYLKENKFKNDSEAEEKDAKAFKKEKKEKLDVAKRRVKAGIILAELGRLNKIEVTDEEALQSLMTQFGNYPGDINELLGYYKQNREALEYVRGPLMENKVFELIKSKLTLKEKSVTFEQFNKLNS